MSAMRLSLPKCREAKPVKSQQQGCLNKAQNKNDTSRHANAEGENPIGPQPLPKSTGS